MAALSTLVPPLISGAAFGTALVFAGVASPAVILGQMRLQNFHMMQSFLVASAASVLSIHLASYLGWAPLSIRQNKSLARFSSYDANIIGGLLIGVGMGMTGACPGTVFVQVAHGIPSGTYALFGGIGAGLLFEKLAPRLRNSQKDSEMKRREQLQHTLQDKYAMTTSQVLATYELLCTFMIIVAIMLPTPFPSSAFVSIRGGLFIGLAQGLSLLLTRKTVGVSSAFEDAGHVFWKWCTSPTGSKLSDSSRSYNSIIFALGLAIASRVPATFNTQLLVQSTEIMSKFTAVIGGFAMVFGARLAGGCTSGHGISGMATFSVSSFITVAAMFTGGIATALLSQ